MPPGSRDRKSRDNSSSDSSDSSDDNIFTKRKGRSKITIYQDTDVAERVTKMVGDCDKLSLVETPYTKWGIHLAIKEMCHLLGIPYIFSKGRRHTGFKLSIH